MFSAFKLTDQKAFQGRDLNPVSERLRNPSSKGWDQLLIKHSASPTSTFALSMQCSTFELPWQNESRGMDLHHLLQILTDVHLFCPDVLLVELPLDKPRGRDSNQMDGTQIRSQILFHSPSLNMIMTHVGASTFPITFVMNVLQCSTVELPRVKWE